MKIRWLLVRMIKEHLIIIVIDALITRSTHFCVLLSVLFKYKQYKWE